MKWRYQLTRAVAVACVLLVAACGANAVSAGAPVSSGATAPATPSPAQRTAPAAPSKSPSASSSFHVAGASFISPDVGWALGQAGCSDCAGLLKTTDGGRHWTALKPPPAPIGYYDNTGSGMAPSSVTDVAFANAEDGFLYGPAVLVTHDGGQSWTRSKLPRVVSFAVAGGYAYAITSGPYTLWRAPVATGKWAKLSLPAAAAAPPFWSPGLVIHAERSTIVLLQMGAVGPSAKPGQDGRLWVSTEGKDWKARPVPCTTPRDGGAAILNIARAHPDAWLLDCFNNEQSQQAQQTQQHLYGTADGGRTWVRLADPATTGNPVQLADNGSGHAFLAVSGGVRSELRGTFDGAVHWQTVLALPLGDWDGWADLTFPTRETGYVVIFANYTPQYLYRTDNAGLTWRRLAL